MITCSRDVQKFIYNRNSIESSRLFSDCIDRCVTEYPAACETAEKSSGSGFLIITRFISPLRFVRERIRLLGHAAAGADL